MKHVKWMSFSGLLVIVLTVQPETCAVLLTPNDVTYTFFPLNSTQLKFKVRSSHNAHILLTTMPGDKSPSLEVILGGWRNSRSAIRLNRAPQNKAVNNTAGILSDMEFRGFWVNCSQNAKREVVLAVGKEREVEPFLQWTNRRSFKPQYYGIRTAWGSTGEWIIDDPNLFFARVDLYGFYIGQPAVVTVDLAEETKPYLIWKVHNSTITEGNFDISARYHATQAYKSANATSGWQAKLFITNVTLEDIDEEMYLTARSQYKAKSNAYHIVLHAFNATAVTDDESFSLNETSDDSNINESYSTTPIMNETGFDITEINGTGITETGLNESGVTAPSAILKKITRASTIANVILTTKNVDNSQLNVSTTQRTFNINITPSKSLPMVTTPIIIINMTSKSDTPLVTQMKSEITNTKSITNSSSSKQNENVTTPISIITSTIAKNVINITTEKNALCLNITTITIPEKGTFVTTNTTKPSTLTEKSPVKCPPQSLHTYDEKLTSYHIVFGVLTAMLVVMLCIVVYGVVKHKRMTGKWLSVKYQAPISMDNFDAADSTALIQYL